MRILVVEDERNLAKALCDTFEEEGFSVDIAHDGASGFRKAELGEYDAVVLDLMLPGMDGITLLTRLRETKKTPVLILSACDTLPDKLTGLNTGADDYVTKPFELEELIARVRALIRRGSAQPSPKVRRGDVEVDLSSRTVRRGGQLVPLSRKEYSLLEMLLLHRGRIITRRMAYQHLFDEHDESVSNLVEVYVARLRRKLGADMIETRRGVGYIVDG